jgi:hypothetical protein
MPLVDERRHAEEVAVDGVEEQEGPLGEVDHGALTRGLVASQVGDEALAPGDQLGADGGVRRWQGAGRTPRGCAGPCAAGWGGRGVSAAMGGVMGSPQARTHSREVQAGWGVSEGHGLRQHMVGCLDSSCGGSRPSPTLHAAALSNATPPISTRLSAVDNSLTIATT